MYIILIAVNNKRYQNSSTDDEPHIINSKKEWFYNITNRNFQKKKSHKKPILYFFTSKYSEGNIPIFKSKPKKHIILAYSQTMSLTVEKCIIW